MALDKQDFSKALDELTERFGNTQINQNQVNQNSQTNNQMGEEQQRVPSLSDTGAPTSVSSQIPPSNPARREDDDEKDFFINQIKAMTAALSLPLSSVVTPFEGDPRKFKRWVKEVEKYALMSGKQNHEVPTLAYMTCKGSVGDFIKRYLDETEASESVASWNDLKKLLKNRFSEITDPQHALAIMRRTKQFDGESVQLFAERLLQISEDAFDSDRIANPLIQQQLVDIFCDGIAYDYLRMKILRENPRTLESAVEIAMKEQNIRKRLTLRSTDAITPNELLKESHFDTTPHFMAQNFHRGPTISRHEEPMEVDHYRGIQCYKCRKKGHKANKCPTNQITKPQMSQPFKNHKTVNLVTQDKSNIQCWRCHEFGHMKAECQTRMGRSHWRNDRTYQKRERAPVRWSGPDRPQNTNNRFHQGN